jgi:hypothetical protein
VTSTAVFAPEVLLLPRREGQRLRVTIIRDRTTLVYLAVEELLGGRWYRSPNGAPWLHADELDQVAAAVAAGAPVVPLLEVSAPRWLN